MQGLIMGPTISNRALPSRPCFSGRWRWETECVRMGASPARRAQIPETPPTDKCPALVRLHRTIPLLFSISALVAPCRPLGAQTPASDDPLVNRGKSRRAEALRQFGGDQKTERAVAEGLAWLAAHQRSDGVWDRRRFDELCPADDRCSQTAISQLDRDADVGVSALAALAFLGAGHTHERGPYSENLSKVFSYILAQQSPDGSFSPDSTYQNYNDAIAAIAIAEAYILTKDPILKEPLERVMAQLVRCQQRGGGWDLTDNTTTDRNDSSVSSWVLMAFKSAEAAGVSAPIDARFRLLAHYDNATLSSGRVWHANKTERTNGRSSREIDIGQRRYGPGITATGLYARAAFGLRLDDAMAEKQIEMLLKELPKIDERNRPESTGWHNEYYWYYGTMAMFNVGGEPWKRWNESLRSTVMEHQERPVSRKGKHGHAYGSWPAFGRGWGEWGRSGGRIYSTAINTLTLEIYYRYVPAYLSPQGLIGPLELRAVTESMAPSEHSAVLKLAVRLHPDTGEPVLLELLTSPNADVRLGAALALADLGSPMGRDVLLMLREDAFGDRLGEINAALKRLDAMNTEPRYGKVTAINSQAGMLLFETGGAWIYYEQPLQVVREGEPIGTIRVNRRFSPQQAGAARIESTKTEIKIGDVVVSE